MVLDFLAGHLHFLLQLRQWSSVALFQLIHAPGKILGQQLHLALYVSSDAGEPFVLYHKRLDLGLGERAVMEQHLLVQRGLSLFDGLARLRLGVDQGQAAREGVPFLVALGLALYRLEPVPDTALGDLAVVVGIF